MSYESIRLDKANGIATITLDRPDHLNAYTLVMHDELVAAFDDTDADEEVGAVIVTGAGRAFCAGADLSAGGSTFAREAPASTADEGSSAGDLPRDTGGTLALRIYASTKPVIAAINGSAVGVGATMTLPMDVRLAVEGARIGFVFTRRGIVPDGCSSWFLPRAVGINRAAEWIYTGRLVEAEEAQQAGLLRSVHAVDELLPAARAIAREIIDNSAPVSVALSRQLLWRMLGAQHPMEAHIAESRGLVQRGGSADVREGIEAFFDKRPPRFPQSVPGDLPNIFPGWEEPGFPG